MLHDTLNVIDRPFKVKELDNNPFPCIISLRFCAYNRRERWATAYFHRANGHRNCIDHMWEGIMRTWDNVLLRGAET
jgi:hypothetical protein